jgi:hypothetical protein
MVDHEEGCRADHGDIADTNGDTGALCKGWGGQQRRAACQEGTTLER